MRVFHPRIFVHTTDGRDASRERAQLRSKVNVNNDGRVRKSPTVQRIENDTTRCATMTRRNEPGDYYIPVVQRQIDLYGMIISKGIDVDRAKIEQDIRIQMALCIYFNDDFRTLIYARGKRDYSYDLLSSSTLPYSYDNERCEILVVRYYHRPMQNAARRAQHP